jgi:hypothetical protein
MKGQFARNRRGLHSIIGAIFFVLIILTVGSGVFLWTVTQNLSYQKAILESNKIDHEQFSEKVVARDGVYTILAGDQVQVDATLSNVGSVPTKIVNLWVHDVTLGRYGFNDTIDSSLGINLKSGDTKSTSALVEIPGAQPSDDFEAWFVTARGNAITIEEKYDLSTLLASQIGLLTFNFAGFRYFTYYPNPNTRLQNYPEGNKSYNVPSDTYVAFGAMLTNVDPKKRTMIIDSHTLIWVPDNTKSATVHEGKYFYVVNAGSDGTIASTVTNIELKYGETKLIVFASSDDGNFSSGKRVQFESNKKWNQNTVCTFILIHGTFSGTPYGQNIPFVALYIT